MNEKTEHALITYDSSCICQEKKHTQCKRSEQIIAPDTLVYVIRTLFA